MNSVKWTYLLLALGCYTYAMEQESEPRVEKEYSYVSENYVNNLIQLMLSFDEDKYSNPEDLVWQAKLIMNPIQLLNDNNFLRLLSSFQKTLFLKLAEQCNENFLHVLKISNPEFERSGINNVCSLEYITRIRPDLIDNFDSVQKNHLLQVLEYKHKIIELHDSSKLDDSFCFIASTNETEKDLPSLKSQSPEKSVEQPYLSKAANWLYSWYGSSKSYYNPTIELEHAKKAKSFFFQLAHLFASFDCEKQLTLNLLPMFKGYFPIAYKDNNMSAFLCRLGQLSDVEAEILVNAISGYFIALIENEMNSILEPDEARRLIENLRVNLSRISFLEEKKKDKLSPDKIRVCYRLNLVVNYTNFPLKKRLDPRINLYGRAQGEEATALYYFLPFLFRYDHNEYYQVSISPRPYVL